MRRGAKPTKAKNGGARSGRGKPTTNGSGRSPLARRLADALAQQAATAEILRVMSASPTDVQPVFDTIAEHAMRLCEAVVCNVCRFDGDLVHLAATTVVDPEGLSAVRAAYPMRLGPQAAAARTILRRTIVHIPDVLDDPEYGIAQAALVASFRSVLGVPMLRHGVPLGSITVGRPQPGPYSDEQIALLQTFAAQAVIAIENVRLFKELEVRNGDLTESLSQQTATAEILRVMSASPTDVQPVFDTIAGHAMRLCGALHGSVLRFDGELIHLVALANASPEGEHALRRAFPTPPGRHTAASRAILTGSIVNISDVQSDADYAIAGEAKTAGYRSIVAVPMLHDGRTIGTLNVHGATVGQFSEHHVRLLRTFADQAVIAIENVRLFRELEARNRDLTATSEILQVISSSPTDVQPVVEVIASSAARLCDAPDAAIFQLEGDVLRLVAHHGSIPSRDALPATRESVGGRSLGERQPIQVADLPAETQEYPEGSALARGLGIRTMLSVPLIREGVGIGVIQLRRTEVRLFTEAQIELLKTFAGQAVIAIENVRLFTELQEKNRALTDAHTQVSEALERQTATSQILQVISQSPTDAQPVFDAIVASAVRLCGARFGLAFRFDGEMLDVVAHHAVPSEALEWLGRQYPMLPNQAHASGRAILGRAVVDIPDLLADPEYVHEYAAVSGFRSILAVPMLREGVPIGVIAINRAETGPSPDKQVALLKTFADQAVIAIENVRLFNELEARNRELTETLEQQTATSEILRVISQSPTDVQPVFDTIAEHAWRLCDAAVSGVCVFDGELVDVVALGNVPADSPIARAFPMPPSNRSAAARAVLTGQVIHIPDGLEDPEYRLAPQAAASGFRATLAVPMLREGSTIGSIVVGRSRPGPFSARHIELLKTFADQAVIAIANVRLFKELEEKNRALTEAHAQVSEALEQQTATGEVLRAINRAQTDAQPVFDIIAASALRLCRAVFSVMVLYDGTILHLVAIQNAQPEGAEALRNAFPRPVEEGSATGRAIRSRAVVSIPDVFEDPYFTYGSVARVANYRSVLAVPMMRDGEPIGVILVTRPEAGPFSSKETELLKTFADQAVIAIENVRLFTELQEKNRALTDAHAQVSEALEQQTATSQILQVISSSPTDVYPVFATIAQNARRLCDADSAAVLMYDGELIHMEALEHASPERSEALRGAYPMPVNEGHATGRAIRTGRPVHIPDALKDQDYILLGVRGVDLRSVLSVPLLREGVPIGAITVHTWEDPRPFSDKHIDLLRTFADQAVIAIENVRLFKELEAKNAALTQAHGQVSEALEQQTATAEILSVISGSPTDIRPVFEAVLDRALTLCDASHGSLYQLEDGALRHVSARGAFVLGFAVGAVVPLESAVGRAVLEKRTVHIEDVQTELDWQAPEVGAGIRRAGIRAIVIVPLLREQTAIGAIIIRRLEVRPFSEKHIRLLQTFADQAVIAIENVRLFTELEEKNRALTEAHAQVTEALEQQTATSQILQVISQSPTDVQPVFDAILDSAVRLCAAHHGAVYRFDGDMLHLVAHHMPLNALEWLQRQYPMRPSRTQVIGRAIVSGGIVEIPDVLADPEYAREFAVASGFRSMLAVPMLREGAPIGVITINRPEPGRFRDKQVALLRTFADQAVIAIENVRLFTELEEKNRALTDAHAQVTEALEQQTATGQILQVISQSPTDVQPVFDAILRSAVRLCAAHHGGMFRFDGDMLHLVAHQNMPPDALEWLGRQYPMRPSRAQVAGRAILTGGIVELPDILADPEYARAYALASGFRSILAVPILRDGAPIGVIAINRTEAGRFPDKQVALLRTFADQAVIAIENVRLFTALEARTQELTRSVGELRALGEVTQAVSSTLELETVLDTIVSRAVQLSGSQGGIVYEFEEATRTFHARASHGVTPEHLEALRAEPVRLGEGAMGRAGVIRKPVQIADIEAEWEQVAPQVRERLVREGTHSLLAVPLVREDRLLGGLVILRGERGAFSPEIVATLQSFATQSVLAIHNAGLFREIQRQKQYSEALVETSPVAIVTMNLDGTVAGWNPGAERLFGYTSVEALGRRMEDLIATPEGRDEVRANIRQTLAGEWIRAIAQRARKDGTVVDVEISSMPVVVDGVKVGMIGIYHDITELLQARREAEAANEAKSAFLATMSHEIRTPMNAVIGMSGLLLNTVLSDEQREYAEVVRESGDALLTVINDILDFSKIEAGKLELESQPFDLRECIESALDLVATRAAEKGLDLAYVLGEGTPAAIVGDVTRLRQILLNLLSNAVKFTERGEVVLSVSGRLLDEMSRLHELTFSVRDTGIGIPADRLGRLFQSFSQVDASTTRRYGGTGLGLAISQRLTELMGGRIDVTSEVGTGSDFRFTVRAPATELAVAARRDLSGVQPSLRGKRVLVVDDNATNRRILTAHLGAWGMVVDATESPRRALESITGGDRFDVAILDMHMPEMDGVTLAHAFREHPTGARLPLVLFTSLGRREARADEEGFAAYLHKPIKPSQLFDTLMSVLAEQPVHVAHRAVTRTELDPEMAHRHPLRILLAEDNVVNQKLALRLLGQMGYRADLAANGLEAIDAVERQVYDVVLMDVQMPELDGFEASREINRRWPGEQRPRIVAMTANAMQGDRELCEAAGMDDYVAKPIRIEELVAALGRSPRRPEAGARSRADADDGAYQASWPLGALPETLPSSTETERAHAVDRAVFERLRDSMGAEFVGELTDTFLEDGRELVATLRRALAGTDLDAFRRAAHSLKSNSETLGALTLARLARQLETLARAGTLDGAGEQIEPLAREYDSVTRALGELRRDLSA